MPDAWIRIPSRQDAELRAAFERWRREWTRDLQWGFVTRHEPRQLVARVGGEALAALPAGISVRTAPSLAPHLAVAARVRDVVFTRNGSQFRGTTCFAPGALVYAHAQHSGDGYERVFFTGRDRNTGRWATSICETRRFEAWHRLEVEDPELLFHLATHGGYWREAALENDLLTSVGARAADPAAFGWDPALWRRLTSTVLAPARPGLAACAAIILGSDEAESRRVSLQAGHLGALLAHAERAPGSASPDKLARAKPAWARLAPAFALTSAARSFGKVPPLFTGGVGPEPPITPRPSSLTAVVAWCSDEEGVRAAEALARRIAVALGCRPQLPILWRIASHAQVVGWLRRPRDVVPRNQELGAPVATMGQLVLDLIDGRPRPLAVASMSPDDPVSLNVELVGLGYALDTITVDRIELLAPDLPVDAALRRELAHRGR